MKVLAFLLLFAAPAFCDTLYTFSAGTLGFTYDETSGTLDSANWPWDIYFISFAPPSSVPSTEMELAMIDNDGSGEPISAWYEIFGFSGDYGTYTAYNTMPLGNGIAAYGLPSDLTLNVTDPPGVPEPASFGLVALAGIFCVSLRFRKFSSKTK